ncbi:MAG: filamentous hemagglutinin N-terminal domain-containing protein, partial [Microcoleaceae cyanobacterium MO_207.B10]|nr:filamentous hemagglutinin N-terminal domain-containing protein [Microcoleaceae cyanobacterium MO_207.B10]
MTSGENKVSTTKLILLKKIANKNSKKIINKSTESENKNNYELLTNQLSPIADIAARISPISYLAYLLLPSVVKAQPIVPATDGTNTIVNKTGDRFNIQGGRLSKDGVNLFHSFREFNLYKGQTANFSTTKKIRNIITRVAGGNTSFINGLISITGGNSNLYIMNPAGIIFGKNAQLNIPAAFSATTATGIEFNNHWFNSTGENNYAQLIGNPSAFTFPKESAPIINNGNLAVKPGENITLMAGSVVNNGTLKAPGGEIRIAAIPNQSMVRISKEGHLLSLEVPSDRLSDSNNGQSINPLSLPKMLTGGSAKGHATGVTVNKNGQLVLTGDETIVPTPGSVVISGKIDTSATQVTGRYIPPLDHQGVGGKVEILGDRIALNRANINVSGDAGGGTVYLGNHQLNSNPTFAREKNSQIHVSRDSVISADANITGGGGKVAIAGEQINISGHISARGSNNLGKGGSVEISGGGNFNGTVDVSADNHHLGNVRLHSENITVNSETNSQYSENSDAENHQLTLSENSLENMTNNADVVLSANNDININNLSDNQLNLNPDNYRTKTPPTQVEFVADSDRNRRGSFAIDNRTSIINRNNSLTISGENVTLGKITGNGRGTINLMSNQINFSRGINAIDNSGGTVNIRPRYTTQNMVITENYNINHNLVETTDYPSELAEQENTNTTPPTQAQIVDNEPEKKSQNLNQELTLDNKQPTIIPQSKNIITATLNRRISPVKIDNMRSQAFANELKINIDNFKYITEKSIRESLSTVANQTSKTPGVIYIVSNPEYLELILFTAQGSAVFQKIETANNEEFREQMRSFIGGVSHPSPNNPHKYLTAAQKLYEWLILPLEAELEKRQIDMLIFSLDPAMRSIPFAALHDG